MFDSTNFHIKDEHRFMTEAYYQHRYDPSRKIRLAINIDDGRILLYYDNGFKRLHRSQSYFDALSTYDKLPELYGYKQVTFGEFYSYREDD